MYVAPDGYFVVGTAGSGPQDRIDAGDEASMKILCPTGGVHQYTEKKKCSSLANALQWTYLFGSFSKYCVLAMSKFENLIYREDI